VCITGSIRISFNLKFLFFKRNRCFWPHGVFVLILLILLPAAARTSHGEDIAVILSANADAYSSAVDGFRAVVEGKGLRIVKVYDMRGDFNAGRKILNEIESEVRPDLIYVVGVWALQMIAQEKPNIPVVYAMVLNPSSVIGSDATNITGASMNVPVDQTMRFLKLLKPEIRRVGTVFHQATTGYLIEEAHRVVGELGLQLIAKPINSSKDAIMALKSLQDEQVDALWIVPDKAVLGPKVIKQMLLFSYRRRIPLLGLSRRHAEMGTLLATSFASSEDNCARTFRL